MSAKAKGATEGARLAQVNVRLPDVSIRQIAQLREALGLRSDAAVIYTLRYTGRIERGAQGTPKAQEDDDGI